MGGKRKKLSKKIIISIITAAVVAALILAFIITNIFIPVKYLSAYMTVGRQREAGIMTVTYLDMGFGDSALIELPDGKTMLIDGGNGSYGTNLKLMTKLNECGTDTVDYLVCTSVYDEHCGGLADVVKYKNIGKAFIPYCHNKHITDEYCLFIDQLRGKGTDIVYAGVSAGGEAEGYDCFFTFLSPTYYLSSASEYAALNNANTQQNIKAASAVMWLQYGETAFVFASDASASTLKRIVDDYKISVLAGQPYCGYRNHSVALGDCDIVTVAGHGDKGCTYAEWYNFLLPAEAIVSVGRNYAGCPSVEALGDVCNFVREPRFTKDSGDIIVKVTADGYTF